MNEYLQTPAIAVVIATRDRPHLLADRALASVAAQTRPPNFVVIVDDSCPDLRITNRAIVDSLKIPRCSVTYLENARTEGASGSWNTAIAFLLAEVAAVDGLFVAILDDDDAWLPTYLARCEAVAAEGDLDMVAAGLRWIESVEGPETVLFAPETLSAAQFLVGNPGIQGSNIFVRFSVLLAAGGFDEALRSTTDRDLCIRIADLGWVCYGRIPEVLVDHHADADRARLSTRGSAAKLDGLSAFWRKHAGRMSADQREAFAARAASLFGWIAPAHPFLSDRSAAFQSRLVASPLMKGSTNSEESSFAIAAHPPSSLYVGVITSAPMTLLPLLRDLNVLSKNSGVARLATVVLDNASPVADLEYMLREARDAGLQAAVVSVAQQREDAAAGAFGKMFRERPLAPVGIAAARTMLQRYVGTLMEQDPGSFAWLLDDDMRVDSRALGYLRWLPAFRDAGVGVLIGAYEGSSPNPPLNGLRVQLVDIFHSLVWLRGLPEKAPLPDRSAENAALRAQFPDYYYDLSRRHTAHLETPHWIEPMVEGETVAEARVRLLAGALGILTGQPITRAIVSPIPANPIAAAKDSVNRGGNTFVLDHRALTQTPNTIVGVQGREARRSDMIWAIVNRHYRRMNVKAVAFPVRHIGRATGSPRLDIEKVQGEIVGAALYAGLVEFLHARPGHMLDFSSEEAEEIRRLSSQQQERRLQGLRGSIWRIIGLREAIRGVAHDRELEDLLGHLDLWFTPELFEQIRDGVHVDRDREMEAFLMSLRALADDYASTTINTDLIQAQFRAGTGP